VRESGERRHSLEAKVGSHVDAPTLPLELPLRGRLKWPGGSGLSCGGCLRMAVGLSIGTAPCSTAAVTTGGEAATPTSPPRIAPSLAAASCGALFCTSHAFRAAACCAAFSTWPIAARCSGATLT